IPDPPLGKPGPESINPTTGSSGNTSGQALSTPGPPKALTQQDDNLPIPERMQPQRQHKLPGCFTDFVPHSAIPPETVVVREAQTKPHIQRFQSHRNIFGLSRTYFSASPPSHDPNDISTLADLVDYSHEDAKTTGTLSVPKQPSYYLYPNLNSFALGNWYWTHRAQKSHEDFKALLNIIGSPDFKPEDVRSTP
ncbi:hypothetical protein DXG01_006100, partial [Tephrocybe rancida]